MKTLIDGYNLMHARGVMLPRFGPDGLRKARHRFLVDLSAALGPFEAATTTVVFDASDPPPDRSARQAVKGLTVLFAVDCESADALLESLIAGHSAPKTLTVVSSDLRVRDAARRRKAIVKTSDTYLVELDDRRRRKPAARPAPATEPKLSAAESTFWMAEFAEVQKEPGVTEALRSSDFVPTDDEIARIEREVQSEAKREPRARRPR